ncbi:hypothetical protein [Pseudolactococcus insecticola]|uniref:Uncharacterized protein n=1 Tax=Pseudolactococcus insecticola TaxID=2709158 RepID=A0A6A0BC61_9LACT|nr:hypothetical protein [Lactococcus insecticola]GFH41407.1 hypothetical protein Hs20B_18050 [Lactococcus insecticola]
MSKLTNYSLAANRKKEERQLELKRMFNHQEAVTTIALSKALGISEQTVIKYAKELDLAIYNPQNKTYIGSKEPQHTQSILYAEESIYQSIAKRLNISKRIRNSNDQKIYYQLKDLKGKGIKFISENRINKKEKTIAINARKIIPVKKIYKAPIVKIIDKKAEKINYYIVFSEDYLRDWDDIIKLN